MPSGRGGARPCSGNKKGVPLGPQKATITAHEQKALAREVIRDHVRDHIPAIITANVDNACGVFVMTIRHEDGSFEVADTPELIKAGLAKGGVLSRVYARQPNQPSAAMLLAYAADKPIECVEVSGPDGAPMEFVAVLQRARERLKQR